MRYPRFINNKKDRYISYIIVAIITYSITMLGWYDLDYMMFEKLASYQMNVFSMPEGYASIGITIAVLTIAILIAKVLRKDKIINIILVAVIGVSIATVTSVGGYIIHDKLLLDYATQEEAQSVRITDLTTHQVYDFSESILKKKEVQNLIMSLKNSPEITKKIKDKPEVLEEVKYEVYIGYEKKYGIILHIQVYIGEEYAYFRNGHGYSISAVENEALLEKISKIIL